MSPSRPNNSNITVRHANTRSTNTSRANALPHVPTNGFFANLRSLTCRSTAAIDPRANALQHTSLRAATAGGGQHVLLGNATAATAEPPRIGRVLGANVVTTDDAYLSDDFGLRTSVVSYEVGPFASFNGFVDRNGNSLQGILTYRNGVVYDGFLLVKKPHGTGKITLEKDGSRFIFEGSFWNGEPDGQGTLTIERGRDKKSLNVKLQGYNCKILPTGSSADVQTDDAEDFVLALAAHQNYVANVTPDAGQALRSPRSAPRVSEKSVWEATDGYSFADVPSPLDSSTIDSSHWDQFNFDKLPKVPRNYQISSNLCPITFKELQPNDDTQAVCIIIGGPKDGKNPPLGVFNYAALLTAIDKNPVHPITGEPVDLSCIYAVPKEKIRQLAADQVVWKKLPESILQFKDESTTGKVHTCHLSGEDIYALKDPVIVHNDSRSFKVFSLSSLLRHYVKSGTDPFDQPLDLTRIHRASLPKKPQLEQN